MTPDIRASVDWTMVLPTHPEPSQQPGRKSRDDDNAQTQPLPPEVSVLDLKSTPVTWQTFADGARVRKREVLYVIDQRPYKAMGGGWVDDADRLTSRGEQADRD